MNTTIESIPYAKLVLSTVPVLLVLGILYKWSMGWRNAIYALSRMTGQLLLIGYVLGYIFQSDNASIVITVLANIMPASGII